MGELIMSENTCSECNGSGVYQGLNTVEPCRMCQQFSGQPIRHEIEEQIAEPIEIPFPIHTMSQVSIDVDTRFGKGKRTENTLEMELVISSFICSLTDIIQSPSRYAEYKRLIQGQDRFTAIFQCGDDAKRIEDVMMVACQPSQDGAIASFILEWEPDDA